MNVFRGDFQRTGFTRDAGPTSAKALARARFRVDLRLPKDAVRAWRRSSAPFVVDAGTGSPLVVIGALDFAYSAHAIDKRGALVWTVSTGIDEVRGGLVTPFLVGDALGLGVNDGIALVDGGTGTIRHRISLGSRLSAAPAVIDDGEAGPLVVAPTEDARVVAVDAGGAILGRVRWRRRS